MAHLVLTSAQVSIGGTDLSDHVTSVSVEYTAEDVDDTNMGSGGARERLGGLTDYTVTVEFAQDYAASAVDATLFGNVGSSVAWTGKPTDASTSSTNPQFSGNAILTSYSPLSGSVGEKAATSVTLPGTGTLTRATS